MNTVYSFHDARSGEILATATAENLQTVAQTVARALSSGTNTPTRRAFTHNGLGIIAAGLCRAGTWTDILRDDFQRMEPAARAKREAAGLPLHKA